MPGNMRPGDVIADRYRLIDLLNDARGARFWLGWDSILARHIALHIIDDGDPRADELRAAAKRSAAVHDPRMLRVLDIGTVNGFCYVVNEWGEGRSLNNLIVDEPLAPRRAAWLVGEVAELAAVAHAQDLAHGRLVPENVMIDESGSVKVIGFAVDAALHGLPAGRTQTEVLDLAGLLYAALTGRWAGPSNSSVAAAPQEHGRALRPRQVRAGVPRILDALCDEVLSPYAGPHDHGYDSAASIAAALMEYVGDPAAVAEAEAARHRGNTSPRLPKIDALVLAPDPEPVPEPVPEPTPEPEPEPGPAAAPDPQPTSEADMGPDSVPMSGPDSGTAPGPEGADDATATDAEPVPGPDHEPARPPAAEPQAPLASELTVAGAPVFFDEIDQVGWMNKDTGPQPPPPPPFEEPDPRPLFAPDPEDGQPVRTARPGQHNAPGGEYWPWETGVNMPPPTFDVEEEEDDTVPGRNWMRFAWVIGIALIVLVALLYAFNQGRDGEREEPPASQDPGTSESASPSASRPVVLEPAGISDLDPFGEPAEENPEQAGQAIDGDTGTAWSTMTYEQQFGPGGLKPGVGLVVDLGEVKDVRSLDIRVNGDPTEISVFVADGDAPTSVDGLESVASGASADGRLTLETTNDTSGRWVVVWVTALPPGTLRAEISEIRIRG